MPRLVKRLVTEPAAPATPAERERVIKLIGLLDGYSLMPALKGIMALLSGDPSWLRVRAPLVALTADEYKALEKTISAFAIDTKSE